jgi:hypothetical protein
MSGSTPAPAMFSGQSDALKEIVVLHHRWCGAAFGTPGVADRTSRRRDFTFLREVSSQLPPYITYSFLRRSVSSPDLESLVRMSLRTCSGDWYSRSRSPVATSPSSTLSLPGRRRGGEPSLEDCSRRSLTRFVSLMISRHSAALWRLLGCTRHVLLLPPYGRGRLLRLFWPPVAAAMTGAAFCSLSWPRFFFFFFLLSWMMAPEPPVWATPVCGAECHARPSAALAHLSTRAKSVVIVSTSCVANFSNIFSSHTPWRKAVMMEASEIRDIVPHTLVKREINTRRVSLGSCLTVWRWASTPCC